MSIAGKVWGSTELLQRTPLLEVHKIKIKPHHKCSLHRHLIKANDFYCISGAVKIAVQKNDYELTDETMLKAGDYTSVKPLEFHYFETGELPCELLEIYHIVPWTGEDIERRGKGGPAV